MARKSKYTSGQRKAYYSGMGYHAGYKKKRIPFKNESNKASFRQGYAKAAKSVAKYPNL